MDRDVIGAINIGLTYLKSDGRGMAFPSTEPHEVRVKLLTPHRGLTSLTKKHREEENASFNLHPTFSHPRPKGRGF
jgi:transposase